MRWLVGDCRSLPGALPGLLVAISWATVARCSPDLGTVLSQNANLSTYYDLIQKYPNILLKLPNYSGVTIVAPNNGAFTKDEGWSNDNETMVTNILEYHILQGTISTGAVPEGPPFYAETLLTDPAYTNVTGGQNVIAYKQPGDTVILASGDGSRSTLVQGDIAFAGGLVQVIDTLLVPPARLEPTARVWYPDLQAFLGAVYAAGLDDLFAQTANVTIFAPRNEAFQRVAGAVSSLDNATLAAVLKYHLIPGGVLPSTSLHNGTNLTSASDGAVVHVTTAGNNMYVDSATVVQPDILMANGVVHIIDNVLNPAAASVRPNPSVGTQAPVFAATGATDTGVSAPTPFASALPCTTNCPVPSSAAASGAPGAAANGTATGHSSTTGGVRSTSSKGWGAAAPRCTGAQAAAGLLGGVVGMGIALVV